LTEWDQDIQGAVKQALRLQASGSWRTLERLGSQAKGVDHSPGHALLSALCINPLQEQEKGRDSLTALAATAPRSACSLALGRSLLALAQEQILTSQRVRAEATVRQALACSVEAAAAMGLPIPADLPDQLFGQVGVLLQTLTSQLDLELARQREQLPAQLVLVLGMHRSGTSALSGLLVESGLNGPADLMPASPANPKGYFESLGATELNDRLLADLGTTWCMPTAIPKSRWISSSPEVEAWRSGMLRLLFNNYARGGRVLLKDPRLCILLPGLHPWLESNLLSCVAFMPVRHPSEVVESLLAAQSIPRRKGLMLWLRHIFESERHSRAVNRLIIRHHDLIANPNSILSRCHDILAEASRLDRLTLLDPMAASRFIDPQLYRQRASPEAPEWIKDDHSGALYAFALQVYSRMTEDELPDPKLQTLMDDLWVKWASLLAHLETILDDL